MFWLSGELMCRLFFAAMTAYKSEVVRTMLRVEVTLIMFRYVCGPGVVKVV